MPHMKGKSTDRKLIWHYVWITSEEGELSATFGPNFMCYQDHSHGRSSEALCHHQRFYKKFQETSSSILGKLCHEMSSTSILGNLYFQPLDDVQVQCAALSLGVSCEFKTHMCLVAQGWLAVPEWHLLSEFGKSPSGGDFSKVQISRWQGGRLKVFISWEHIVKKLLYQHMSIFKRSNQIFTALEYPFVSCGSKEAGDKCFGHIVKNISKGDGFWVS